VHYKRVIPCLDVDGGRVVKGVEFVDIRDAGDPVELAAHYDREGADELVFLDITATHEKRETIAQLARVLEPRDTAADGERDRQLLGGVLDEAEQGSAAFERRGDVEEHELVGAQLRIARRELDRVAHVTQVLEADALDDAPTGDVEARDQTLLDHARTFSTSRAPGRALRSGWNWTPATGPRSTAATTVPSCSTVAAVAPD